MSYYKDLGAEELSLWDRFKQGLFPSGVAPTAAAVTAPDPATLKPACVEYSRRMGHTPEAAAAFLAGGSTQEACVKKLAKMNTPSASSSFPIVPVVVGAGLLALVLLRRKR